MSRYGFVLIACSAVSGAVLSGCGGGGGGGSSTTQIRAINASANGGVATVSVSGTQIGGGLTYFATTPYQSQNSGPSSVTFSLSAAGTTYPALAQDFSAYGYYSLVLVGRSDVTATDPRYPSIIVVPDTFNSPSTNQAAVRLVLAAPDAGPVDVLVNGSAVASGAAYKSVSSLFTVLSGNVTVQVSQSGSGTALVQTQTLSLTAGHVYTLFVVEPIISATPAYSLQEIDNTNSL